MMGFLKRSSIALAAAALLLSGRTAGAQVFFQGSTSGCFNPSGPGGMCASGDASAQPGLTYNSDSFSGTSGAFGIFGIGGGAGQSLGSFVVATSGELFYNVPFLLSVIFTAPIGVTPNAVYSASLIGSASSVAGGGIYVDFDNSTKWYTFPTSDGVDSFKFSVNDVSVSGGQTGYVTGTITATPEPGTMMLFGTGLVGLAPMIRRRRKKV